MNTSRLEYRPHFLAPDTKKAVSEAAPVTCAHPVRGALTNPTPTHLLRTPPMTNAPTPASRMVSVPVDEYGRLIKVCNGLIGELSDPGTEALAAVYCAERILHGGLTAAPVREEAGAEPDKSLLRPAGWKPTCCYCPPDRCGAPVIMGRQTPCLRAQPQARSGEDQ